ncbi:hypothetical protein [Methylosinus sp. Sm6]|uniref:hypothetical protein n=1 Tax=Methylosinus sp. Sm6 TaxID=2866948 RepID=UPI001C995AB2|nr:hypothetical protein [Methylosinus sp. Sm6]MBY6241614.1 hypothetical protein [Methylosinus sp. Sm6]
MNKIVREHYPASQLPADLREEIGDDAKVTVTIVVEDTPERAGEGLSWFDRHKHIQRDYYKSTEEVNEYVRALRDEWSHRER